jgi:uncharacterized protein (TIGR00299 family) protein
VRVIHLDAVGGIAGDMFAAALLDALPELRPRVLADMAAILPTSAAATLREGRSGALRCLRLHIALPAHDEIPGHHALADYRDMMARIAAAPLAAGTAQRAGAILTVLAEAEARIHGITLENVHFHEIADWDSLADVVAAGSIAAALEGAGWTVSALPRGGGMVRSRHGALPVPAPATAEILTGYAWRDDGIGGERVTPTGAAILRHLGARPPDGRTLRLDATGTGAGTRELPDMANILRALVFEDGASHVEREEIAVLAFDIDDMTGEEIGEAARRIRGHAGVLDLSLIAASGKKSRPVTRFELLARPEAIDEIGRFCLMQTATIGLRWRLESRMTLPRIARTDTSPRRKESTRPDGRITVKAESDDLRDAPDLATRRRRQRAAEQDREA